MNPDVCLLDEFPEAFIGLAYKGTPFPLAVYDLQIIAALLSMEGLDQEDRDDYIFNSLIPSAGHEDGPILFLPVMEIE